MEHIFGELEGDGFQEHLSDDRKPSDKREVICPKTSKGRLEMTARLKFGSAWIKKIAATSFIDAQIFVFTYKMTFFLAEIFPSFSLRDNTNDCQPWDWKPSLITIIDNQVG